MGFTSATERTKDTKTGSVTENAWGIMEDGSHVFEELGNGSRKRHRCALAETAVKEAKKQGYVSMRLDALPEMGPAIALYLSLGFQPIAPYRYNPIPGASFWELGLRPPVRKKAAARRARPHKKRR